MFNNDSKLFNPNLKRVREGIPMKQIMNFSEVDISSLSSQIHLKTQSPKHEDETQLTMISQYNNLFGPQPPKHEGSTEPTSFSKTFREFNQDLTDSP